MPPNVLAVTTYSPAGHITDISYGDIFQFRGLTGEPGKGVESGHEIMVVGITMWGDLLVKERYAGADAFTGRGYEGADRQVSLQAAVFMIEQGIWKATLTVDGERPR